MLGRVLASGSCVFRSVFGPAWKRSQSHIRVAGAIGSQLRSLFVQTQPTPNPESLKFVPGVTVLDEEALKILPASSTTVEFPSATAAAGSSPLAARIFRVEGVKSVMLGTDFVTITKQNQVEWSDIKPDLFATLTDFFGSGAKVLTKPVASSDGDASEDDEVVATIKDMLESRIRPVVQEDGGDIEFRSFEDGVVKIKLQGACSGCPSSTATLKGGIETLLMYYIPEVVSVEEEYDEVDAVSDSEFAKFEERLKNKSDA